MSSRYPGYDVLSKRHTESWNEMTREVIDRRIAVSREPSFFSPAEWETLNAVCDRILPQPKDRPPIPTAALVDNMMEKSGEEGFRIAPLPYKGQAWKRGLPALDAEARSAYGARFADLHPDAQDALLKRMEEGELKNPAWGDMPSKMFFSKRVVVDIPAAYYSHPTSWNEIGWGGPASPRGYVRTTLNRRDAWEAVEAKPGKEAEAREKNKHVG